MIVVTGGAGFIGSNLVAALATGDGREVAVCDVIGDGDKWRNLAKHALVDIVPPDELFDYLEAAAHEIDAIVHMGAISSTTETDVDWILANNFRLSLDLWGWCTRHETRFIYASSAATYGDGGEGFDDDGNTEALARLPPRLSMPLPSIRAERAASSTSTIVASPSKAALTGPSLMRTLPR